MIAELIELPAARVAGAALGAGAGAVWVSHKREFVKRWASFAAATPVLLLSAAFGPTGLLVLALALAVVCCWECARVAGLEPAMQAVLTVAVLATVCGVAFRATELLALSVALPLLAARAKDGFRQAGVVLWCAVWIGGALAVLPQLGAGALAVAVAVSLGDVAAYAGGALGRRVGWTAPLSAISPNKTWAGAVAGSVVAVAVLAACSGFGWVAALAVTVGGVSGDLIESLVKRGYGAKDAGAWLPGFGGLLDRVDSLLGALLVIALFS